MNEPVWRGALPADLETIAGWVTSAEALERWAGPELSWPIKVSTLWREIDGGGVSSFCLAERGLPIAFGQLVAKSERHRHLARIIVSPDYRRRGLGERLCKQLIEKARQQGAIMVTLNVFIDNHAARDLYRRLGFTDQGGIDSRGIQLMQLG